MQREMASESQAGQEEHVVVYDVSRARQAIFEDRSGGIYERPEQQESGTDQPKSAKPLSGGPSAGRPVAVPADVDVYQVVDLHGPSVGDGNDDGSRVPSDNIEVEQPLEETPRRRLGTLGKSSSTTELLDADDEVITQRQPPPRPSSNPPRPPVARPSSNPPQPPVARPRHTNAHTQVLQQQPLQQPQPNQQPLQQPQPKQQQQQQQQQQPKQQPSRSWRPQSDIYRSSDVDTAIVHSGRAATSQPAAQLEERPVTNRIWSFLACLIFPPLGILSCIKAEQSRKLLVERNYYRAKIAGDDAKGLSILAIGIFIFLVLVFLTFYFTTTDRFGSLTPN